MLTAVVIILSVSIYILIGTAVGAFLAYRHALHVSLNGRDDFWCGSDCWCLLDSDPIEAAICFSFIIWPINLFVAYIVDPLVRVITWGGVTVGKRCRVSYETARAMGREKANDVKIEKSRKADEQAQAKAILANIQMANAQVLAGARLADLAIQRPCECDVCKNGKRDQMLDAKLKEVDKFLKKAGDYDDEKEGL